MSSILKEVVMINRFNLSGLRQPNKPCQRLRELSTICPNRFPSTSSNRSQQNAPSNVETFPRKQKSSSYNDRLLVLGLLAVTGVTGIGLSSFGSQRRREKEKTVSADKRSDSEPELTSQSHEDELSPGDSAEQSAFNPETGEINWDCPCLGGMAHGVCGEQFKAAFSCFVYSDQEPKGVECIDKFKLMQDCFKDHPDEYGPELTEDEETNSKDEDREAVQGSESDYIKTNENKFRTEMKDEVEGDQSQLKDSPSEKIKKSNPASVSPPSLESDANP